MPVYPTEMIARTPYPKALEEFPVLRQSTLSTFDDCGLTSLFDRRYRKSFSDAASGRGTIWHRWAAKALGEMADQSGDNEIVDHLETDVGLAILQEVLRQADVPIEDVVNIPMREIHDLTWMVKKFCYETRWNIAGLVSIEERLNTTVRYPNPYGGEVERILSGQPDALFAEGAALDRGIVIDYKTGWWLPPPSEVSESGFFQQRFYALLEMRNHPTLNSVTLREFYPRYSQSREATIYREQLDEVEGVVTALAERFDRCVQEDTWHPSPGSHCGYCSRPTACPIFPTARKVGRIRSDAEAEVAAAQVLVGQKAIKQTKEALKVWTSTHGPVPVRDAKANRVFGHRVSVRRERPTQEQMERALQMGQPLDTLYREQVGTRFEVHIPKPQIKEEDDDELLARLEASLAQAQMRRSQGESQ